MVDVVRADGQGVAIGTADAVALYEKTVVNPLPVVEQHNSELLLVPVDDLDPFDLEVHRAIEVEAGDATLPVLPRYVQRPHDLKLQDIIQRVRAGRSDIAILVGGSSAGKTRACWEAVQQLPDGWRLWHPISPEPAQAVLDSLAQVPPYTVIWLNELQHYLISPKAAIGEKVSAELRELVRDARRAPVLILGTIWPEYLSTITAVPIPGKLDRHSHARTLVDDVKFMVPSRFELEDLATAREAARDDPRLHQALMFAQTGEVTQYLAGAPAMVERYRVAPAFARAVIEVAVDARRLGYTSDVSRSFLEQAAPGYMSETEWQGTEADWLERALDFAGAACRGAAGLLVRRRPKPGEVSTDEPCYRVADYFAQWGRGDRCFEVPPTEFWVAARKQLHNVDGLLGLAGAAATRWRLRYAALLFERVAELGELTALVRLGQMQLESGNTEQAELTFRRGARHGDWAAQVALARLCDARGDTAEAKYWLRLAGDQGAPDAKLMLAQLAEIEGDNAGAEQLLRGAVEAAEAPRSDVLRQLAQLRVDAGDAAEAGEFYARANTGLQTVVRRPLKELQERSGGLVELEHSVRQKIAEREALGNSGYFFDLDLLAEICADKGEFNEAELLAERAARAGYPAVYRHVVAARGNMGDHWEAERLALRAAAAGDAESLRMVADALIEDNRWRQIRRLGLEPDGTPASAWT